MAERLSPRQRAARMRKRHPELGTFIKQTPNGNSKSSPQYSTPVGITTNLSRMLRPQAAFRWILPNRAAITPQYVEMVMRGALAGNHVQQWEIFDFMLDSWPALATCFQELTYGVLGKKMVFEPHQDEDTPPTPSAIERHKLVSIALQQMNPSPDRDENDLQGTIKDLLDAWLRGITLLEVLWEPLEDDLVGTIMAPKSTFWCHPVTYGFNADGQLGLRTVGEQSPGGISPSRNNALVQTYPMSYLSAQPQPAMLEPFPDHKFLVAIHKSKPGTALGGALLRPLVWWWVASGYCEDWLLNLAQLYGIPFRFATYDPNAPDETVQAIQNMLQNMGSAGWAAFPAGTTMEFQETGGGRNSQFSPQGTMLDRADRYAREVILGQTMTGNTMTSGKGGQAFGVVEKDVKQERIDAAGKFACEVINKQLIASILLLNYGDLSDAPRVRLLEENEGQFVDAQRDQILQKMGVKIGEDFIAKKYGIPEIGPDEEVVKPDVPEPFGGGGGFGDQSPPDGEPMRPNEMQPGMEKGDKAMAAASGAYAPGHPFYGNQWTHSHAKEWDSMSEDERLAMLNKTYPIGKHLKNNPSHEIAKTPSHKLSDLHKQLVHTALKEHVSSKRFPSITHSAEDERRHLQNMGIQTKLAELNAIEDDAVFSKELARLAKGEQAPEPQPQIINVNVEAAPAGPTTKTFKIKRSDGTVIEGEIAAKEEEPKPE